MDPVTLGMIVLMLVGMYFLFFRPQQKRVREQQEMIASLEAGTRVLLTSGVLGTIRHLGTNQVVIEVSPGVELTLLRQAIVRPVAPDEEEFEYSDGADDALADEVEVPDDLSGLDATPDDPADGTDPTDAADPADDAPAGEVDEAAPAADDAGTGERPADRG